MMLTNWHQVQQQIILRGEEVSASAKLVQDSRKVRAGDVFVALKGIEQDGGKYIGQAISDGAAIVLVSDQCEPSYYAAHQSSSKLFLVEDLERSLPAIAKSFYRLDESSLKLVGVTGTNGKTSITHLLAQVCRLAGAKQCATIGTMGTGHIDDLQPTENTTPGVTDVYRLLDQFQQDEHYDYSAVAMEVSSHALQQNRVKGLDFDVAVFTNLTLDHLDYHGSMEQYFAAKTKLFTEYQPKNAVVNVDDEYGKRLINEIPETTRTVVYGFSEEVKAYSDYVFIKSYKSHLRGLEIEFDWQIAGNKEHVELQLPIYGEFNCSNLAAVYATALLLEWPIQASHFAQIKPVPGRLELFVKASLPVTVVDYAHTPDALKQSLLAVKKHLSGRLFLVFGCGGDRDRSKRPIMASIAEQLADEVVVTNDNPRTESEQSIADEIVSGFSKNAKFSVVLDRKSAIKHAISAATENDVVLIAGKGHETYQIVGQQVIEYDERAYTRAVMEALYEATSSEEKTL